MRVSVKDKGEKNEEHLDVGGCVGWTDRPTIERFTDQEMGVAV